MESRKMVQQWRHRHREQIYENWGEERAGGVYGEANIETYGMICTIDRQCEFAVWLRELKPRSGIT